MSSVAICSLVRDGMSYLPSYRSQLDAIRLDEGDDWRLFILEGDSSDGSHEFLLNWAQQDPRVQVGKENVGHAHVREDRAQRWARAGNACLELLPEDWPYTHVLWLEADLCFPPELVHRLLDRQVDVVAPMIYLGGFFYDTWGFRDIDGRKWTNLLPYHPDYRAFSLMAMGSVGSCVLFRREVLDAQIRFRGTYENGLLVGICNDARAKGFRVWADTATAILHPVDAWQSQMWSPNRIDVSTPTASQTLTPAQAGEMGLDLFLPLLDEEQMHALSGFWITLYRRFQSNRLTVVVKPLATGTRKQYDIQITVEPRQGLARNPLLLALMLKGLGAFYRGLTDRSKRKNAIERLLISQFAYRITFTHEEA